MKLGRPIVEIKKIPITIHKYFYPDEIIKKGGKDKIRKEMRQATKDI